ncbi:MAG: carbohydrate ABC transporter permease [Actinomycetota bacterium]
MTSHLAVARRPRRVGSSRRGEARSGWLFLSPVLLLLALFLIGPILLAFWVSLSDWSGRGSPLAGDVNFVGLENYADLLTGEGIAQRDFGTAMRNNLWYVLLVVPTQTALALWLAVMVTRKNIRGRGFFRTAFYFPSVTSAVASTVLWLFLFSSTGTVNKILSWIGLTGPNWFNDSGGVIHNGLRRIGVEEGPTALTESSFLNVTWWDWFAGPSVAMFALILLVIFTTSGTFMLLFMAALQSLPEDIDEAAFVDGAGAGTRLFRITLPQIKPTIFTVLTLGLISSWQVFDQIYTATQGEPGKTTITPAYLSYSTAFNEQEWGRGAAISFILFLVIVAFTVGQGWLLRDRDKKRQPRQRRAPNIEQTPLTTETKGVAS